MIQRSSAGRETGKKEEADLILLVLLKVALFIPQHSLLPAPQNRESGKCISALVQIRSSGRRGGSTPAAEAGEGRESLRVGGGRAAVGRQGKRGCASGSQTLGLQACGKVREEGRRLCSKTGLPGSRHCFREKTALELCFPSSLLEAIAPQLTGIKRGTAPSQNKPGSPSPTATASAPAQAGQNWYRGR